MYVEDFSASAEKWVPGIVSKVTGPLSYHVQLTDGRIIRRHIDSVRSRVSKGNDPAVQSSEETLQDFGVASESAPEAGESVDDDPQSSDEPQAATSGSTTPATTTVCRTRLPPAYYGQDNNPD